MGLFVGDCSFRYAGSALGMRFLIYLMKNFGSESAAPFTDQGI